MGGRLRCEGVAAALLVSAMLYGSALSASGSLPLKFVEDVPLSGGTTRLDYESYDPRDGRLYIAHLGDSTVIVFDTKTGKVVKNIPDVGHVHGVLAVPELNRVYASGTKTDEVVAIDEATLQITARIPGGDYPDGMAYVPVVHKLYVSDESGATETVIDTVSDKRLTTLQIGGEVGNTQYDPVSGHVFVNVQTRDDLVEIDPQSDKILGRYPLPGARGNHGLLIAAPDRLAFIACEDNDKLLVFDLRAKRVTLSFDVGGDPDVLAFDPGLNRIYVAGEKGVVSVFTIGKKGSVTKLGEGFVGNNAHIVAVDPDSHKVYFPLKDMAGRPVMRVMEPLANP
jgi:YVTN family beta-propeller protein